MLQGSVVSEVITAVLMHGPWQGVASPTPGIAPGVSRTHCPRASCGRTLSCRPDTVATLILLAGVEWGINALTGGAILRRIVWWPEV